MRCYDWDKNYISIRTLDLTKRIKVHPVHSQTRSPNHLEIFIDFRFHLIVELFCAQRSPSRLQTAWLQFYSRWLLYACIQTNVGKTLLCHNEPESAEFLKRNLKQVLFKYITPYVCLHPSFLSTLIWYLSSYLSLFFVGLIRDIPKCGFIFDFWLIPILLLMNNN